MDHDHPDTDLTDPDGEAEALRRENARLRAERDRFEAALAASRAPDPVANADSCQPGGLISREAVQRWITDSISAVMGCIDLRAEEEAAAILWLRNFDQALRALPAAPVAEAQPVAWRIENMILGGFSYTENAEFAAYEGALLRGNGDPARCVTPLYAHPPAQPTIGGAELDALVERLRKLARDMERDATDDWDEHEDVTAAADAITALRAQPDWKAMAERLREALTPFGIVAQARGFDSLPITVPMTRGSKYVTVFDFLNARAALSDLAKMKGE